MNHRSSDYKNDLRLVNQTILNLVKGRFFLLIAISVLVLAVLYSVAKSLLNFGRNLDYSFLNDTPIDLTIEYLEKYDVYFWWAIVIIISLFVLSFLNSIVRQNLDSLAKTTVPMPVARSLITRLSPMALEVLDWVWHERREPLKVHDIRQVGRELRQGRFSRIEEAREQERLLNKGLYGTQHLEEQQSIITPQEPVIRQTQVIAPETATEPSLDEALLNQNDTARTKNEAESVKDEPKAW